MATQFIGHFATNTCLSPKFSVASGNYRYSIGSCNNVDIKNNNTTCCTLGFQENFRNLRDVYRHGSVVFKRLSINAKCGAHHHVSNDRFPTTRVYSTRRRPVVVESAVVSAMNILFRFSRPYAAMGTVLGVISTSVLAVESLSDLSPLFFIKVFQAIFGGLCMQIYVCGFNQICDIEIDKINKPCLPLASGELSMNTAIIVTSLSAIMSLWMVWISGSWPLFWGLFAWFFIGTAYSANLPLLRWKRYPYTAILYMINSRALATPFGYYLHVQNAICGGVVVLSRRHFFSIAMLLVFSVVLILFKDIPDIKGDEMHGIKSLASQIGPQRMFWSCIWVLGIAYGVAIYVGATSSSTWSKYVTVLGHLVTVLALWVRAKSVDLKSITSVSSMYLFLWKVLYVEYLLLPLVR